MSFFGQVEGTSVDVIDPRFRECLIGHARVERLWSGARWLEGPAYFAAGRYLIVSDIPNNRMLRLDETDDSVSVFRHPSNHSNGNTVDMQGRLISCEHLTRRVTRTEHDGSVSVVTDRWNGKRFNSPNDVIVKSDGTIWFTDPDYGIRMDYEGEKAESEIGSCNVYRFDPATGKTDMVTDALERPNGLAFSRDEKILYIADTGISHRPDGPHHIRAFTVKGATLSGGAVVAECTAGVFDGFRIDQDGRLWTSARDGVHCYLPDGTLIGKIRIPEIVANVTFGGVKRNRLFICGTTSIYSLYLGING